MQNNLAGKDRQTEVRIVLPWPPSLNNMFLNVKGRGRVRSENYRKWAQDAGWLLLSQHPYKFKDPVRVRVELNPPNARAFDLDNRNKALLDLLVEHGVIVDDSNRYVRAVSVEMVSTGAPCTVIVEAI